MSDDQDRPEAVAIIGMAGRFPGASNVDQFWRNLRDGIESIVHFADDELLARGVSAQELADRDYVKVASFVDGVECFDATFFGINRREAEIIDPQHRMFLEAAWKALENAGYEPTSCSFPIGLFAGVSRNTYVQRLGTDGGISNASAYQQMIGNDKDYLTTRVAYKLNLKGPSVTVQTACSSSLVAVNFACQSLLMYQCDMSLAGGVSINLSMRNGYRHQEGMILSLDGHCRAFDHRASGTVSGEGVGIVVLKRLSEAINDGDTIHAVILGSAINNDGSQKVGYTAPSVNGQAEVITMAQSLAEVGPETIDYVETHGTGTPVGDPIEIKALTQAFRTGTENSNYCAIGSVKTNIGHADAAAGVAGLIKTALALKHKQIPPSLHFERPNPEIDFDNSPFYVNTELKDWESNGTARRAGVSSFGIGGTNAHVVMEEAPTTASPKAKQREHLLLLSARSENSLDQMTGNLAEHLREQPDTNLADVAYTLQVGRKVFSHTRSLVARDVQQARQLLSSPDCMSVHTHHKDRRKVSVTFLFPGQGSQHSNMAQELYDSVSAFRTHFDQCCELLRPQLGFDLKDKIFLSADELPAAEWNQTVVAQPAIFAVSYSMAKCLEQLGIVPECMIGHGVGEIAAACLAGVFSLPDALESLAVRAKRIDQLPPGKMLAVRKTERALSAKLNSVPGIELAAINGPEMCVVAGPTESIELFQRSLESEGVVCRPVHTSHAFQSAMMDPVVEPLAEMLKTKRLAPPAIPIISSVTGDVLSAEQATDPQYWARHLRETIRFTNSIEQALVRSEGILLEVGPGQTLSVLARQHPACPTGRSVLSTLPHAKLADSSTQHFLATLGRLWQAGAVIDWSNLHQGEQRHRVPLPTYPFEPQRYWVDETKSDDLIAQKDNTACIEPDSKPVPKPQTSAMTSQRPADDLARNVTDDVIHQQLRIMRKQLETWSR